MFSEMIYLKNDRDDFFIFLKDNGIGSGMYLDVLEFRPLIEVNRVDWLGQSAIGNVTLKEFSTSMRDPLTICCGSDLGDITKKKCDIIVPKLIDGYIELESYDFLSIGAEFKNKNSFIEYNCHTKIHPISLYTKIVDEKKIGSGTFHYLTNLIKKVVWDKEYRSLSSIELRSFSEGVDI